MTVLRIKKKQSNFVILDKTCLHTATLTWEAKGLHSYLLSLPDDWQIRVTDLQKRALNGRDAVRRILSELECTGYIKRSATRYADNGRFGCHEYLVLEYPELCLKIPDPEIQALDEKSIKQPCPDNQAPVFPASEKPTLINNKLINNKLLNNKTAALSSGIGNKLFAQNEEAKKAAAVQSTNALKASKPLVSTLKPEDVFINNALTANQCTMLESFVRRLKAEGHQEVSVEEITFCLLNPKNFTACGQDFSRKLNAIRKVIIRGDWQTPIELVTHAKAPQKAMHASLLTQLREVIAERNHFQNLLPNVKELTERVHFYQIIEKANLTIQQLEEQLLPMSA